MAAAARTYAHIRMKERSLTPPSPCFSPSGKKAQQPADAKPKRRGPKTAHPRCVVQPTTSADSLQTIDEATLQEFRQKAALEEATRVPEVQEPESEPQRFNFHR
eukprot:1139015-Pelagomonas_calceolata.AAC.3